MEEETIPEMVDAVRTGKMRRRQFMRRLTLMGISAAGIGAIAAAASHAFNSKPVPQENSENAAGHLQLHDEHLAHQSQGDIDQLHNDYAEHAIVEDSLHPYPFVGREAIIARKRAGMAAIAGVKISVTKRVVRGNELIVEWVASGKHTGDFPGLSATGRSFSIPGVTVVVRQNGKIVRESLYYDVGEVYRQLGAG